MKIKTHLLPTLFCGLVVAVSPALRAQDASPSVAPSTQPPHGEKGEHRDPLERFKALDLTEDQKAKIKPILEDTHTKMKAVHQDTTLSDDQRKEKMKALHEASNEQIKALLTPDQVKKFDQIQQEMKDHRKQQ